MGLQTLLVERYGGRSGDVCHGPILEGERRILTIAFCQRLLRQPRLVVCLLRYGDTEPAAQNLHGGPASGIESHIPLSGSERDLYRAVSAATAAGGGALPWGAAAERESR